MNQVTYRKHEAGAHLITTVPTALHTSTASDIWQTVRRNIKQYSSINYVYLLDEKNILKQVVSLRELLQHEGHDPIEVPVTEKLITVRPHTDQERVAHIALHHNLKAVPVVDADHVFLGIIPSDTILRILDAEHQEDLLRMSGVSGSSLQTESHGVAYHIFSRLPWLLLGLAGGGVAALVVAQFEEVLAEVVILAACIPAVVYMADAVGSQTQTILIRKLQHDKQISLRDQLHKELLIAVGVGLLIALVAGAGMMWWQANLMLGLVISLTFLSTIIFTSIISVVLPYVFYRLSYDPAVASGPLATVIRDVSSLIIFFALATLLIIGF